MIVDSDHVRLPTRIEQISFEIANPMDDFLHPGATSGTVHLEQTTTWSFAVGVWTICMQ